MTERPQRRIATHIEKENQSAKRREIKGEEEKRRGRRGAKTYDLTYVLDSYTTV